MLSVRELLVVRGWKFELSFDSGVVFCGVKLFARHQMMVHSTALGNCQYLTVSHTLEFALEYTPNIEIFVSYIYFGKFENIPRSFQNLDNISYLLKFRKLRNMFSQLGRKNDVGRGILKNVDNYCHFQ